MASTATASLPTAELPPRTDLRAPLPASVALTQAACVLNADPCLHSEAAFPLGCGVVSFYILLVSARSDFVEDFCFCVRVEC